MSWWTNFKTFINVGFLTGTDLMVTKTFGDYETAASAQADVNRLAAIMDNNIISKKFSKRKSQEHLFLEDLLGEEKPEKPEKPEDIKAAFIEWFNSLDEENRKFVKDALK